MKKRPNFVLIEDIMQYEKMELCIKDCENQIIEITEQLPGIIEIAASLKIADKLIGGLAKKEINEIDYKKKQMRKNIEDLKHNICLVQVKMEKFKLTHRKIEL